MVFPPNRLSGLRPDRGKKYLRTFLRGKRVERQVKARLIQRIEHLRRRRYGQAYGFQQFDLREDLLRCSVRENAPRVITITRWARIASVI